MSTLPAVLLAAGGVGFAHSVLPDHWAPLAVVSRARHEPLRRVARLSLFAGLAHVVFSLLLGVVVALVGLSLRSEIESRVDAVVGGVLILTGVGFLVAELRGRSHAAQHRRAHEHGHEHHHDHAHDHDDGHEPARRGVLGMLVPFGAAASPDLTILPVFLAAAALGVGAAIGSLVVFSLVTVATFVGLTTLATAGGFQLRGNWIDRYANPITAGVLIVIGALVAAKVL